ncbi:MAG: hypothetical protein AMXMBFR45_18180 [Gammaproteobacteria bacterium]|nr:MAG: hypothetical protein EDM71_08730 [Pseudomonadota bacterium]MBC6946095.1 hypothetical protein [Gammaproteobacteria bacterium]MCE7896891.1 hypothetical protein [Gammaproteobacteria bacterium PRO8]MDL1879612.1 hypothetical protein [Gammaproteobacteria bacterium PRO2]MCQ3934856.1 hypothetical protein [Gammaproteobacteria bacterium]
MADRPTTVVAALLLGCCGVFAIMGQPILVEVLVTRLGMQAGDAFSITALEALGTALGPVLALSWMQRLPWRLAAVSALLVIIGGNILSAFEASATTLGVLRFLIGLLGEGTAFALAVAIVGNTRQKDRNFAFLVAAQVLLGVLFFRFLPMPQDAGVAGVTLPMAGLAVLALLAAAWIPQPAASGQQAAAAQPAGPVAPALAALAVMLLWCTGLGAIWASIKLVGVEVTCPGCDATASAAAAVDVGKALALSTGIAVIGALAAAAMADRFGRLLPVSLALAVQLVMVLLLRGEMPWLQFAMTVATFQTFWNMTGPYLMGNVAANDTTGKFSLLIPTIQIGGFFLGPTLTRFFLAGGSYAAANYVAAVCIAAALLLFIATAGRSRNAGPGPGH